MIDMFKSIMSANNIKEFYGIFFLLWLFALLYFFHQRKKWDKIFQTVVIPAIVSILVIYNPVCSFVIEKCLQGSFWRVYWVFNIVIIVACAGVRIVFDISKKREQVVVALFLFVIVAVGGNAIYSAKNFQEADNMYKIPSRVIELCEVLQESKITNNVAVEPEDVVWLRQYDSTINMLYGRDLNGLIAAGLENDRPDVFIEGLKIENCDFVIIEKKRNWDKLMLENGHEVCAETEYYDIWKVR